MMHLSSMSICWLHFCWRRVDNDTMAKVLIGIIRVLNRSDTAFLLFLKGGVTDLLAHGVGFSSEFALQPDLGSVTVEYAAWGRNEIS